MKSIDPSSPSKVKYDIFRRINTGGKPLKNQEIRNCLAGSGLRDTLNEMVNLQEFKTATDYSIKSMRMEDQEVSLRFIYFYRLIELDKNIDSYSGNMESSLDNLTEELAKSTKDNLSKYVSLFSNSMQNAEYLFGSKFAFRKVRTEDIHPNSYKQLINKALFVCWSVLLSEYDPIVIKNKNESGLLLKPLAKNIEEDIDLLNYLSYGTNGKNNLLYAFKSSYDLIQKHLKAIKRDGKKIVAITLSRHIYDPNSADSYHTVLNSFVKFTKYLLTFGYYIVLLPFNTNEENCNENDILIHNDIMKILNDNPHMSKNIMNLTTHLEPLEILELYQYFLKC